MLIKTKKRSLCIILMLAVLFSTVVDNVSVAEAVTQNDAVAWARAQISKGLDYDGEYGNQCVDLIKYYYSYFGVASYAKGNANAYITNDLPPGWTRVYGGYKAGDIGVWKVNYGGTGIYGHVGIITSADSVGFNAVNQNYSNQPYCTENWFSLSVLACAIRPAYTSAPQPAASVSFADFSQNAVWDTNAEMYTKIMNPGRAVVSSVGCYLYDSNGALLKSYSEQCGLSTSYVNYNCNINNDMKYTLQPGTTYKFVLYGVVNGKEYRDVMRSFTTTENVKPVISDASVVEVSETGYTVRCKASDNIGVDRVQFPTWTVANGQDDIQKDWGSNRAASGTLGTDGYYTYRVNISDHNYELGEYITHIYAFDKAGNSACYGLSAVKVQSVVQPTTKPTVQPTAQPTIQPTVRPAVIAAEEPDEEEPEWDADEDGGVVKSEKVSATVKKPGKVKKVKAKNIKGRIIKVTWKSAGKNCRYQTQIAKNRAFTKEKLNNTTSSKRMWYFNVTKKKTYYVRVRAYRKKSGKKLYGKWSKVKKVKIKK